MSNAAAARRALPPMAIDALLAAACAVLEAAEWSRVGLQGGGAPMLTYRALATASLAVLLVRRRFPVAACLVLGAAAGWEVALATDAGEQLVGSGVGLGLAVALYTLGAHRSVGWSAPVGVGVVVALPVFGRWWRESRFEPLYSQPLLVSPVILLLPLALGMLVRVYRAGSRPTARELELQQVSDRETSRRVVLEERAAIARDLHDSVAHHINLMVVQAETGPDIVDRGSADVLRVFRLIGDTGRRALTDLDRTLALLRDDSAALLAPQPGLDDLDRLVADTTAQGLTVTLTVTGDRRPLAAAVELAAYRIVQESLTNVLRHAGAGSARVLLEFVPDGLSVLVTDQGRGFDPAAPPSGRAGHGLPGMRERARINGGTLAVAAAPGAGTAVSAWLPVPPEAT
jgi:signal transduction histidine kinase